MDRVRGEGALMAGETSHYAVVADDEAGLRLARLLDGYIAPQVARAMALLGVPDQLGDTARTVEDLAATTGAAPGPLARLLPPPACTAWSPGPSRGSSR
jgi:hypothetical protein